MQILLFIRHELTVKVPNMKDCILLYYYKLKYKNAGESIRRDVFIRSSLKIKNQKS